MGTVTECHHLTTYPSPPRGSFVPQSVLHPSKKGLSQHQLPSRSLSSFPALFLLPLPRRPRTSPLLVEATHANPLCAGPVVHPAIERCCRDHDSCSSPTRTCWGSRGRSAYRRKTRGLVNLPRTLAFNHASEPPPALPDFSLARQTGYNARDTTHLAGRGLDEISSALGQKPQSAYPHIKQLYCQKASGYPQSFTQASSHTYASLDRFLPFPSPSRGTASTG